LNYGTYLSTLYEGSGIEHGLLFQYVQFNPFLYQNLSTCAWIDGPPRGSQEPKPFSLRVILFASVLLHRYAGYVPGLLTEISASSICKKRHPSRKALGSLIFGTRTASLNDALCLGAFMRRLEVRPTDRMHRGNRRASNRPH
jgi:hypothetical protein